MTLLVGVDVGTTVTKAVAYDDAHPPVLVSRPTRLDHLDPDRYEQDQDAVFESVLEVLGCLTARLGARSRDVEAIGVTAQGDGLWLFGPGGASTRPAISWMDGRAGSIVHRWDADGTSARLFAATGSAPFAGSTPALLAWTARNEPESLTGVRAGHCKDMILARLAGVSVTDHSNAVLFDQRSRCTDPELFAEIGLPGRSSLAAEVVPAPAGFLRPELAERVGLAAGTPVVGAPYDVVASAVGAGIGSPGDGLLIVGTTMACEVLTTVLPTGPEPVGLTLATADPDRFWRAMPAMVGAATMDWVLALVGRHVDDIPALLDQRSRTDVRMLPFLSPAGERAPFRDHRARGRLDGLTLDTDAADLVRAVAEGLAFSARGCFEAAGLDGRVLACGGGVRGALTPLFADVLGQPIHRCTDPEVGARGAATSAALALGGAGLPPSPSETIRPRTEQARHYAATYRGYLDDVDAARVRWASHHE